MLVHSAAGGVGCAALQICETLGCTSVGVVGSDKKIGFLKELLSLVHSYCACKGA